MNIAISTSIDITISPIQAIDATYTRMSDDFVVQVHDNFTLNSGALSTFSVNPLQAGQSYIFRIYATGTGNVLAMLTFNVVA